MVQEGDFTRFLQAAELAAAYRYKTLQQGCDPIILAARIPVQSDTDEIIAEHNQGSYKLKVDKVRREVYAEVVVAMIRFMQEAVYVIVT